MKKYIFMTIAAVFMSAITFAQVSSTPEVPRNYKPKPKELLPMPGELTTEMIFPVLGKYVMLSDNGDSSDLYISLDSDSKGGVWVSGLSEGKFRADLKASPATYKIPAQKTLFNDAPPDETISDDAASNATVDNDNKATAKKFSGKSVKEGTLIYDKEANTIYINLGSNFNEKDPFVVFQNIEDSTVNEDTSASNNKKSKKQTSKGKNYTGAKVVETKATVLQ